MTIGVFTSAQLATINATRLDKDLEPIEATIVCNGKHIYESRCAKDGYSIDAVVEQIRVAFQHATEAAQGGWATVLRSPIARIDEEGRSITDELAFECHQQHPRAALFSVIPRGDGKGPLAKGKAPR